MMPLNLLIVSFLFAVSGKALPYDSLFDIGNSDLTGSLPDEDFQVSLLDLSSLETNPFFGSNVDGDQITPVQNEPLFLFGGMC